MNNMPLLVHFLLVLFISLVNRAVCEKATYGEIGHSECRDKLENCHEYSDEACDDIFKQWAIENCPKRCGYCQNTTVCEDHFDCSLLPKNICTDTKYRHFIEKSCRKHCNVCTGINECELELHDCNKDNATCVDLENGYACVCKDEFEGDGRICVEKLEGCYDRLPNCKSFPDEACDDVFQTWASDNCRKRCGYCQNPNLCQDIFDCHLLPRSICSSTTFKNFAMKYCRKSCGLCSVDIDECALGIHDCDEHATCTNIIGGYRCKCEDCYKGDGKTCEKIILPFDCQDIITKNPNSTSGVYEIQPIEDKCIKPARVYCEMDINGGGWTVFQKRFDGSVDFYRTFEEYKYGFGNASGEYWLGNEYVHYITTKRNCSLRIDLWDWLGKTAHNIYSVFWIDSEQSEYTLHVKGVQGNAGGMFIAHNGQKFSASDRDNDRWSGSCAQHYMGGWWFGICYYSNLNGLYRRPGGSYGFNTTSTLGWRDNAFKIKSLKATRMMMKHRN